ncbi:MAG: DNA starvation/stationary phase protection protein [Gammaproteobacteria bacterium]|nr:DNA starvation/stationary phase protection protein [Gammaproteobacteria bacterium]MBK80111.1 DNA starvation/stationary phase protection protein [Gammaproteobacteria bacterium]|tara:strand:- start:7289 stop:7792 length:504 start_codon:yes stop_codon:yes gene_type:complete
MTDALAQEVTELDANNGLKKTARREVAEALSRSVADTYTLFASTQGLHWNVQGPLFYSVHKMTEEQYQDMFEAIDDLAERIRTLGFPAPATLSEMAALSAIDELDAGGDVRAQIEQLIAGNERLAQGMRDAVEKAEALNDVKTADLLTERLGVHEENAWMLRATIAE